MKKIIIREVEKKWAEIGKNATPKELTLEIELYKKLLNIFQPGEYYFFVFNPSFRSVDFTSSSVETLLGYKPDEFSTDLLLDSIHPDDLPYFVDFESTVVDFKKQLPVDKLMKYKSRYNYRLRKKDGTYISILQQSVTIQIDEDGSVLYNLVFHTDITDLSPSSQMTLSFIGLEGEPSFINVKPKSVFSKSKEVFTKREKEVLRYVLQGFNSEKIAYELNLSIHTIHVHRKNILRKSGCSSVSELLVKSVREGWG
mgnify:FL=1